MRKKKKKKRNKKKRETKKSEIKKGIIKEKSEEKRLKCGAKKEIKENEHGSSIN